MADYSYQLKSGYEKAGFDTCLFVRDPEKRKQVQVPAERSQGRNLPFAAEMNAVPSADSGTNWDSLRCRQYPFGRIGRKERVQRPGFGGGITYMEHNSIIQ